MYSNLEKEEKKHYRNKTNPFHYAVCQTQRPSKTPPSLLIRRSFENMSKINKLENTMKNFKKERCNTEQEQFEADKICRVKIIEKCGVGNFSTVYLVKLTNQCHLLALKKVPVDFEHVNREQNFAKTLKSPFIVKFYDSYYTEHKGKKYLNILMEKHSHNLAEAMYYERLNQITIKIYLYQMFRSLLYLHSENICHRDVKPHNFLITRNKVVLCDFGSSKVLGKGKNVAYLFSRDYRPPQMLFGFEQYGTSVDIWALGCIIGEIVLRKPLFKGNSTLDQILKILQVLGTPSWEKISFTLKKISYLPVLKGKQLQYVFDSQCDEKLLDLLKKILIIEPNSRISALEALCHPFFDDIRDQTIYWNIKKHVELPSLFYFSKKQLNGNEHLQSKLIPFWVKQYCKHYNLKLKHFR